MAREWRGRPRLLWVLVGSLALLGVRGLAGGGQFILVPSGDVVGVSTTVLEPTPVNDFLLPGLFLFVALGIVPLVVADGLYRGQRWARTGAIAVGVLLTGWAILEGLVLGVGARLQPLNLVYGIGLVVLAASPAVRAHLDG